MGRQHERDVGLISFLPAPCKGIPHLNNKYLRGPGCWDASLLPALPCRDPARSRGKGTDAASILELGLCSGS